MVSAALEAEELAAHATEIMPWWSVLAGSPTLPLAGQEAVAHALAIHGTPAGRAAFHERKDLTTTAHASLLRAVSSNEAALLLVRHGCPDVEHLRVATAAHEPRAEFVVLCSGYPELHDHAAQIAAGLPAAVASRSGPS
jgi:hypothetical protein